MPNRYSLWTLLAAVIITIVTLAMKGTGYSDNSVGIIATIGIVTYLTAFLIRIVGR